jgi:glycosyltransferase involved in cell wall biosynthesis
VSEFRLLDVACSDAGIPLWLAEQLADHTTRLTVDGLDLDVAAVKRARDRAAQVGLPGTYKVATALDAPTVFRPSSYDAVTAFEIIEHVPDMTALLSACERMLKPGGRVYVSTPDGTFGNGSNPHHLRALRAIDLADLLRRRGELVDMVVGSDGVSVASYIPRPRREDIAIYTGPGWQPWSPFDIVNKGLGGSETAAVRLAEALSQLGFVVTVYGECDTQLVHQVVYRHHSVFDPLDTRGALIASRVPWIGDRPLAAATRFLWVHDTDYADHISPARVEQFDHILGLSRWHCEHLRGCYPFASEKVLQTRNGIHHKYFKPAPWEDRAQRVLYSSSPDRGLDILLELWPQVRDRAPDAELAYCYPDVYDAIADQDPLIGAHRDRITQLADQPGVRKLGALPQPALAAMMCDTRVWAHPSWASQHNTAFHETSCIGAMEAQAAGCVVVASSWGALTETVRYGQLVNNVALSDRWRDGFVECIVAGLTDPTVGQAAVEKGPVAAADFGWDAVAGQLAALIAAQDPGPPARQR